MMQSADRRRVLLFVLAAACLALAGGYAWMSVARSRALVGERTLSPVSSVRTPEPRPAAAPRAAAGALQADLQEPRTVCWRHFFRNIQGTISLSSSHR